MKRKLIAIFMILSLFSSFSQTYNDNEAIPYRKDEFPGWANDLRRFEIIFFGSVPLSYIFISFGVDSYYNIKSAWNQYKNQDNEFNDNLDIDDRDEQEEFKMMLSATVLVSAFIAIGDFIIGKVIDYQESKLND